MDVSLVSTEDSLERYSKAVRRSIPKVLSTETIYILRSNNGEFHEFTEKKDFRLEVPPFTLDVRFLKDKEPSVTVCLEELCTEIPTDSDNSSVRKSKYKILGEIAQMVDDFDREFLFNLRLEKISHMVNDFDIQASFHPEQEDFISVGLIYKGKVISYAHGYHRKDSETALITFVHTHPEFRGKGYCTLVMTEIFRLLRDLDVKKIELSNEAEDVGYRCYSKAGKLNDYTLTSNGKKMEFLLKSEE